MAGAQQTPVFFPWSQAILAGATFEPLSSWQYETPDFPCMIEVLERATAVGMLSSITSGGDTLRQEGPIQSGGTAGTTPSRLNTEPVVGKGGPLKKLRVLERNPTAGTITVDGLVIMTPIAGGGGGNGGRRRSAPRPFTRRRK